MFTNTRNLIVAALAIGLSLGGGTSHAQKGKKGSDGVDFQQRAEIDKLRADLEMALREIKILRETIAGGGAKPDEGPFYQGRSAARWLEQLKDLDTNYRKEAVQALGVLATKKKDVVPVLISVLKEESSAAVRSQAQMALANLGDGILPKMIEILRNKESLTARQGAMYVVGTFGPKAKDALPLIIEGLKDKDVSLQISSVGALSNIGPDAKAAIPTLLDLFDSNLQQAKVAIAAEKPATKTSKKGGFGDGGFPGGGFGPSNPQHLGAASMPRRTLNTLLAIEPELRNMMQSPIAALSRNSSDQALVPVYEEIQAILRQRFPREK